MTSKEADAGAPCRQRRDGDSSQLTCNRLADGTIQQGSGITTKGKPVASWKQSDEAILDIATGLRRTVRKGYFTQRKCLRAIRLAEGPQAS
jgi:hypothetical protein